MKRIGRLYFAYGSNMNHYQMSYRCPDAKVLGKVRLEEYCLAFRGKYPGCGVATILPEKGSHVDGVLWEITEKCEKSLDRYEGYPHFYGKQPIKVKEDGGRERECMVYIMNAPHKDVPAIPSMIYLDGILEGCRENGLDVASVQEAVKCVKEQVLGSKQRQQNQNKRHER